MTQAEYLEAEFRRYFPTSSITVDNETDDETIHVHVVTPINGEPDHFAQRSFIMEIGSDDDWYSFENRHAGYTLTIPFSAEEHTS